MPRVAVCGLWHETNTFAPTPTSQQDFTVLEGERIREVLGGTRTPLGAFLEAAPRHDLEMVPTVFAWALPSGTVDRLTYETLAERLVERTLESRPDAVLLDLHGAMVAEGYDDVEGDLLRRLRRGLGDCPMGAVLDLHANVTADFTTLIDVMAGYDTYPHVDPYDRGIEVAGLLTRVLAREIRPACAHLQPPLVVVPQAQATDRPPMRELLERAHRWEARSGVLSVTVSGGFAYADVPFAGLSAIAIADGHPDLAQAIVQDLSRAAWELRETFQVTNPSPAEAVARALRVAHGPVVLVDVGDNIGGGTPGDGTLLLAELLAAGATGAVVTIVDPEVVALARRLGEGSRLIAEVGGKSGGGLGDPVPVQGRIERICESNFVYRGSYMTGRRVEAGWAALLDVDGLRLVVRERKVMPFDQEELRAVGLEPADARIIVVKSAIAWRAAYGDLATAAIEVDTPGPCTANLASLNYTRLRRPVVPLDQGVIW